MRINDLLQKYQTIFWDFDGVIKKSNKIKLIAFQKLFEDYGMQDAIKKHHINNQGISRFKKIPIYLEFCKIEKTAQNINDFCNRYSKLVVDEVISSEWVEGALEALNFSPLEKNILITGTPKDEIEVILRKLNIKKCFKRIYGSPMTKTEALSNFFAETNANAKESIFIGDSMEDINAASKFGIDILFIKNEFNKDLNIKYCKYVSNNFLNEIS